MTARFRFAVAVAILLSLAAHPLEHPMVKECPCTHAVGTAAFEPVSSFVLEVVAEPPADLTTEAGEPPVLAVRASRAPPAA